MGVVAVLLAGLVCVAMTWWAVWGIRQWAERRQVLDVPNARSSHSRPTPRGGGLAIVAVVLTASVPLMALADRPGPWLAWFAAALLVASVSWWDDVRGVTFRARLAVHAVAAVVVLLASPVQTVAWPLCGTHDIGPVGLSSAFVWIVGLTNAYNFMDGIDGIAGSQGVVAGATLAGAGVLTGSLELGVLGGVSATACLGFLFHNWPPARIFMGDVGSAFLGFTFAAFACTAAVVEPRVLPVTVFALWPFVFDAFFTFLRRLRRGENVFEAHRSHLYQRLVICGWSHAAVTSLYSTLAVVGGVLGLVLLTSAPGAEVAGAVALPLLALLLWSTVSAQERSRSGRRETSPHA